MAVSSSRKSTSLSSPSSSSSSQPSQSSYSQAQRSSQPICKGEGSVASSEASSLRKSRSPEGNLASNTSTVANAVANQRGSSSSSAKNRALETDLKASSSKQESPAGNFSLKSPQVLAGAGVMAAVIVAGVVSKFINSGSKSRSVDTLTRRGLLYTDRQEEFRIIQEYDSPTEVRDYKIGDSELKEVGYLPPLSEEKRRQHREARMREHGWKKLEMVLVEGDTIPEGVDAKAVRFIPRKHPFALNQSEKTEEWSEEVVRRRLKQRRGRPEKDREEARKRLDMFRDENVAAKAVNEALAGRIWPGVGAGIGGAQDSKAGISGTGNGREGNGETGDPTVGSSDRSTSRSDDGWSNTSEGTNSEQNSLEVAGGSGVGASGSIGGNGNANSSTKNGVLLGGNIGKGVVGKKGGPPNDVGSAFGWSQEFLPPVSDEASKPLQRDNTDSASNSPSEDDVPPS